MAPEIVQREDLCGLTQQTVVATSSEIAVQQTVVATSSEIAVPVVISPISTPAEVQNRMFSFPRTAPAFRKLLAAEIAPSSTPASSLLSPVLQRSIMSVGETNTTAEVVALPPSPISSREPVLRVVPSQSLRAWSVGKQTGVPTPSPPQQQKRVEQLQSSIPIRQASLRSRSNPHNRCRLIHRSVGQPSFSVSTSPVAAVKTCCVGSSIHVKALDEPPATAPRLTLLSDVEYYTAHSRISDFNGNLWSSTWSQDGPHRMAKIVRSTNASNSQGSSTLAAVESSKTAPVGTVQTRRQSSVGTGSTGASLTTADADATQSNVARETVKEGYPLISRVLTGSGSQKAQGCKVEAPCHRHMPYS